ncbi:hypothetical protein Cgig2_020767 [Carnegiea gigantea]|uniref:Receptor-like serine/threonine-protein kinase n=1 Tax=Carnegiea gigantea TaxID=171969 RepID=A0A9Q1K1L6_9CARY|nr:hypothetical protein Cgig2_020767 [Carnegiea gigantea]
MVCVYSLFLFLLYFCSSYICSAIDNITPTQPLQHPQSLVSKNGTLKLGFFSPPNSPNYYMGIWFNKLVMAVVWVANRDKPMTDASGVLKLSENGDLQLLNGNNQIIWSSKMSNSTMNSTAKLLDTGNLVVQQFNSSDAEVQPAITWQSFEHPTNTLLPGMKRTIRNTAGQRNGLFRSWKSPSDPSEGSFLMGIGTTGIPQLFIWNNGVAYWRSGPWDGNNFIGLENIQYNIANGFVLEDNEENGTLDIAFAPVDQSLRFKYVSDSQGMIFEKYWDGDSNNWLIEYSAPMTTCDIYGTCGAFGTCNHQKSPICRCLRGFQPKNDGEWKKGNWSSGCVRKTPLQCGIKAGQQDGFLTLQNMKVPDNIEKLSAFIEDSCRSQCLNNCSCLGYSYQLNIGCMTWSKDLIDVVEFSAGGVDLLLRLAASDLMEGPSQKKTAIIASTVTTVTVLAAVIVYFIWRGMTTRGKRVKKERRFEDNYIGHTELQEPPLYTFNMLRNATNNFQESNKLGEGGFGPVYKGILDTRKDIAVKRLSGASGQGLEEFMNEVVVISKLQHRNLVKLLGCCIEGDEKMLLYEYMPNKSLDAFLFDFGTARIFGANQDQARTRRVVGTYGYMSPEYAMGQFSEKSDVYSFGVILLEIVSGRKNTTFHRTEQSLTLLGHAWKLWNEGQIVSFMNPTVSQPYFQADIIRSIQVGLLCVQELAQDRPTISTVISMLESEVEHLPNPKKPPFTDWDISSDDHHSKNSSINNYSISIMEVR